MAINPSNSKSAKIKIQEKSQILFCIKLKNKSYQAKLLPKRLDLNGHTIGFRSQIKSNNHISCLHN